MKKVLVLEDEPNIRSFVVINLKRAGYDVIEAGTGQDALDAIAANPDIGVATVAAEVGHAQPSTTLAIYTQVYQKRQDSIRSQMSKTLYGPIYRSDDTEK